jgi:hypothetical protein
MSDTTTDPQPTDPPTNTGGGTTSTDTQTGDSRTTDPPTNTGGGTA